MSHDITTAQFIRAAIEADEREGLANAYTVHRALGEDVPFSVVLAKLDDLDNRGVIEGCSCGCSSPLWLVDGKHDNGLTRLVSWDDHDWLVRVARRWGAA